MKNLKFIILPLMIFSILASFSPKTTYACSCVIPGPAGEELKERAAVFSGEVVDIKESKNVSLLISEEPYEVAIKVDNWWKGKDSTKTVKIYTPKSSASCGFEFTVGEKYLVYADEENGNLVVFLCSRTALLSAANDDVVELNKIKKPTEPTNLQTEDTEGNSFVTQESTSDNKVIYWFFSVVGILLVALYLIRRFKR